MNLLQEADNMQSFITAKVFLVVIIWIAIVLILLERRKNANEKWLFLFACCSLASSGGFLLAGRIQFSIGPGLPLDMLYFLLHAASLAAVAFLLLFVLSVRGVSLSDVLTGEATASPDAVSLPAANSDHPLYGIKGWLKVLVIGNLYVGPAIFVLAQLVMWGMYINVAHRYPGLVVTGLISTAAWGYLVYRGIQVARDLRDIRPRAVQNAKHLLKLGLGWSLLSLPLPFLSGINPDRLMFDAIKTLVGSVGGFAIWYSYFNCSRRVEATYPDWKAT